MLSWHAFRLALAFQGSSWADWKFLLPSSPCIAGLWLKVVPFSVMFDFLPLFPTVAVKTTLCNEALLNHPTGKNSVSSQSQSAGPRLSGNPGRWLQCTLPPEQHQAPTWSKAKQIAGVWSRWNFFLHFVPIHIHLAQWEAEACSLEGGLQPEASFNSAYPLGEGQLRVQQWP